MATFKLTTESGKVHTFKARSWIDARTETDRICRRDNDKRIRLETIKVEKEQLPEAILAGHEMVRQMMMANPDVNEAMDLVEASYIDYWKHQRDRWVNLTPKELEETLISLYGKDKYGMWGRDYYKGMYYKLRTSGALSTSPQGFTMWLSSIKKQALEAKDQSINNMIHAIVKIARNAPITHFKVLNIRKGKAGLEGMIKVNDIIKRVYAIYASGPIQCLHIRYLIK